MCLHLASTLYYLFLRHRNVNSCEDKESLKQQLENNGRDDKGKGKIRKGRVKKSRMTTPSEGNYYEILNANILLLLQIILHICQSDKEFNSKSSLYWPCCNVGCRQLCWETLHLKDPCWKSCFQPCIVPLALLCDQICTHYITSADVCCFHGIQNVFNHF